MSVASAVVAYLDCEHYIHLHQNCEKKYKIINLTEDKCISEILYKSGLFFIGNKYPQLDIRTLLK